MGGSGVEFLKGKIDNSNILDLWAYDAQTGEERMLVDSQVLVPDGSTTVIGGVFVNSQSESESYVPLLHKIPGLGHLFKARLNSTENQELLIVLTPRIRKGEV